MCFPTIIAFIFFELILTDSSNGAPQRESEEAEVYARLQKVMSIMQKEHYKECMSVVKSGGLREIKRQTGDVYHPPERSANKIKVPSA